MFNNENEILKEQYMHNQQCFIYALFEYDSEEQFFWKFFSQYRSELQKINQIIYWPFFYRNSSWYVKLILLFE